MEGTAGDAKSSQVRRKGSVKCTLKTKTAHGFSAQRRRPDAKSPRLVTGDDLQSLLAGLKLRRMEQKTDGESNSSPEVTEDSHLHTPATWKEKFSRQMSAGDTLKGPSPSPPKALTGRTTGTVQVKGPFGNIPVIKSVKPEVAKKPATMSKITGKTMLSAFDNNNQVDENTQNGPPKVMAKPGKGDPPKLPAVKSKTLQSAQSKDNILAGKPQGGNTLKTNENNTGSRTIDKSASSPSLVSLSVPCPNTNQARESSPSPTPVSPSRTKTLALKAMFESSSPEATVTFPTSPCRSPNRSPKVARRFESQNPPLPNPNKAKNTAVTKRLSMEKRLSIEKRLSFDAKRLSIESKRFSFDSKRFSLEAKRLSQQIVQTEENEGGNVSKKSSRSSDSSAYDDVVVVPDSGSSDGEGDHIRVRCRRTKDIVESDSGRGSTVSTDDTGTVTTTDGKCMYLLPSVKCFSLGRHNLIILFRQ